MVDTVDVASVTDQVVHLIVNSVDGNVSLAFTVVYATLTPL